MEASQKPGTPEAYAAFVTAQSQFKSAAKHASNPFFKSKYADLASIWDAVKQGLFDNGLLVTQPIRVTESGAVQVETIIRYKDGSVVESCLCPVIAKAQNDPQAVGSAITYARRYSLASILCIVTDDDDANSAVGNDQQKPQPQAAKSAPAKPAPAATSPAPAPTPNAQTLLEWQNGIDALPNLVDAYNAHRKALAQIKGLKAEEVKDLFEKFKKIAETKGFLYNETDRAFYVGAPVAA